MSMTIWWNHPLMSEAAMLIAIKPLSQGSMMRWLGWLVKCQVVQIQG